VTPEVPKESLLRDVRLDLRALTRRPAFALVALLTLALGIGANTAIFSVVHAVELKPLPYERPDELVRLFTRFPTMKLERFWFSRPEYFELARDARSYRSIGAWSSGSASLAGGVEPVRVDAIAATASLFRVLGVPAALGSTFSDEANRPGAEPVVVLGHGVWQSAFGGDARIVGRVIRVDGVPTTVVGVMPRGFDFPDPAVQAFRPLTLDPANLGNRGGHFLNVLGRLAPETGLERARAEIDLLIQASRELYAGKHPFDREKHPIVIEPLHEVVVGEARPRMLLLLGAVGLVLLIACANVASLLLARAETRRRELALRTALGATRARLVRQALVESVLLGLGGGVLGAALAAVGLRAILALDPGAVPRVHEVRLDASVLLFTTAVSLLTGFLFGLAPALRIDVRALAAALKSSAHQATGGPRSHRLRRGLVVAEMAVALMLALGASLMIRSFESLLKVDPGFQPSGLVSLQLRVTNAEYPEAAQVTGFFDELRRRVLALPGVASASLMSGLPPNRPINANDIMFEGKTLQPGDPPWNVDYWQIVADDYFTTLRIPLVEGRYLEAGDAPGAPLAAVVNEAMARKFWPGESPLGRRVRPAGDESPWVTIVGVVGDVKQQGLEASTGTELYMPMRQTPEMIGGASRTMILVARAGQADPGALIPALRGTVASLDPGLPITNVRTLDEVLGEAVARPRFVATLLFLFAAVALLLAAVGIYGVLAEAVTQRTGEIGVRMALGADRSRILRMIVGQGMALAAAGLALGLLGSLALVRLMRSLLFGVGAADPLSWAAGAAVLLAVALTACLLPALRATRVDPMVALRAE
jgi:predicted permease